MTRAATSSSSSIARDARWSRVHLGRFFVARSRLAHTQQHRRRIAPTRVPAPSSYARVVRDLGEFPLERFGAAQRGPRGVRVPRPVQSHSLHLRRAHFFLELGRAFPRERRLVHVAKLSVGAESVVLVPEVRIGHRAGAEFRRQQRVVVRLLAVVRRAVRERVRIVRERGHHGHLRRGDERVEVGVIGSNPGRRRRSARRVRERGDETFPSRGERLGLAERRARGFHVARAFSRHRLEFRGSDGLL